MRNIRHLLSLIVLFITTCSLAQNPDAIQEYINKYKDCAINEMKRSGIPAAIKLAQGIHETEAGRSKLVLASNNHFGIKCKAEWMGESVRHTDDAPHECFRKYSNPEDSYRDHSEFLLSRPRYASLFTLDPTDYEGWAYGLKKAGYATNPKYPQIIIKLIKDYHLQDYTLIALGKMTAEQQDMIAKSDVINEPVVVKPITADNKIAVIEPVNYPYGEFKINDTKVIYAKKGTAYLILAQKYNIPLARLFEFNDMAQQETTAFDQLIYLQRKRKTGYNEFHIVKNGETVYDIAQKEGMRLESLIDYNFLQENKSPAIGEKLYLQQKAPVMPRLADATTFQAKASQDVAMLTTPSSDAREDAAAGFASGKNFIHTVQTKEGLYSISRKYGVSVQDIVTWNHLDSYDLKIGQQLKIYK